MKGAACVTCTDSASQHIHRGIVKEESENTEVSRQIGDQIVYFDSTSSQTSRDALRFDERKHKARAKMQYGAAVAEAIVRGTIIHRIDRRLKL